MVISSLPDVFCAVFLPIADTSVRGVRWRRHRWTNTWLGSRLPSACCHTRPTGRHDGKRTCWSWQRQVIFSNCLLIIWHHCSWNFTVKKVASHFYRAMRCISAVFTVMQCPSICLSVHPSVTFVDHIKKNKHIFEIFSPLGSDNILVFPYQRGADIPTGTPLTGASNARGYDKMRIFSPISRSISETVIDRWAPVARQFVSIEFSFYPYNI